MSVYFAFKPNSTPLVGALELAFVHALFSAGLTFWLTKYYDLLTRQRLIWTLLAALAGWGICLAVVACHRCLVKEACSHCRQATRVDLETCTHCEKPCLPSEMELIEIFDSIAEAA